VKRSKGPHHLKNERHRHPKRTEKPQEKTQKRKRLKRNPKGDRSNNKSFYCSEHGENPTHATTDYFTIKNRDKSGSQGANRSFSNKSFRKEANVLAKKSCKKKALDMYTTAIKREQKKMQEQIAKRKPREVASSDSECNSESDSDLSLHHIDPPKSRKASTKSKTCTDERTLKSVARKKRAKKAETLQEEAAYQKKVQ
jgi:hypothetical protein